MKIWIVQCIRSRAEFMPPYSGKGLKALKLGHKLYLAAALQDTCCETSVSPA